MKTRITDLLGCQYPVIQGGMAWVAEYHLAAAVSEAGGIGLIGAASAPPEVVREQIRKTKELTDKPFGVNVMLLNPNAPEVAKVVVEEGVKIVTTGAGNPGKFMEMWKQAGVTVIPVVASVAMAKMMERAGADAVVAEGVRRTHRFTDHDDAGTAGCGCSDHPGHCRRRHCGRQRNGGSHDAGSGRCADGNTVCGRKRIDRTPEL